MKAKEQAGLCEVGNTVCDSLGELMQERVESFVQIVSELNLQALYLYDPLYKSSSDICGALLCNIGLAENRPFEL